MENISNEYFGLPALDSEDEADEITTRVNELSIWTKKRKFYSSAKGKCLSCPTVNKIPFSKLYKIESDYKILEDLGVGTYSSVKLAMDKKTLKKVAIKISRGVTAMKSLKEEGELLKTIESDYFPKFIDFKENAYSNKSYLIMEYLEGTTLDNFLRDSDGLGEEEALDYLLQLTKSVVFLHENGIVHRDLKPQNVIITTEGKIKIIDFNISKKSEHMLNNRLIKQNDIESKFYARFMTQISSPLFAAPELSSHDYYTESIDVWGLGVVFLCLLKGIELFQLHGIKKVWTVLDQESQKIVDGLTDKTKCVLLSLLNLNPKERPTPKELLNQLQE